MQLPLQTFTSLVQGMAAAVQAASARILDLTIGSTLRAILEATASIGLWMQWLIPAGSPDDEGRQRVTVPISIAGWQTSR